MNEEKAPDVPAGRMVWVTEGSWEPPVIYDANRGLHRVVTQKDVNAMQEVINRYHQILHLAQQITDMTKDHPNVTANMANKLSTSYHGLGSAVNISKLMEQAAKGQTKQVKMLDGTTF